MNDTPHTLNENEKRHVATLEITVTLDGEKIHSSVVPIWHDAADAEFGAAIASALADFSRRATALIGKKEERA